MAKTFTAPFAQTPETWNNTATTAFALTGTNSLADGSPQNTVLLGTAGMDGAMVTSIECMPRATNTATMAAVFIRKSGDAAGIRRFIGSKTVAAQTILATGAVTTTAFSELASESEPLRLQAGDELYFGLGVTQASGIVATARAIQF